MHSAMIYDTMKSLQKVILWQLKIIYLYTNYISPEELLNDKTSLILTTIILTCFKCESGVLFATIYYDIENWLKRDKLCINFNLPYPNNLDRFYACLVHIHIYINCFMSLIHPHIMYDCMDVCTRNNNYNVTMIM